VAARAKQNELQQALTRFTNDNKCRDWLYESFDGLGMKEATHFLRNMGRAERMAMLDRWVTGKMLECGVITEQPSSLTSANYKRMEQIYVEWADSMGIPPRHLDLLLLRDGGYLESAI